MTEFNEHIQTMTVDQLVSVALLMAPGSAVDNSLELLDLASQKTAKEKEDKRCRKS